MPLEFQDGIFDEIVREALQVGDYAAEIDGVSIPIVFERKSIGDLFGTMTKGYKRFKEEMARAKAAEHILILLIEGSMTEIAKGYKYSNFSGFSLLSKLATLRIRYDLDYYFCVTRQEMVWTIENWFSSFFRNWKKTK